MFKIKVLDIVIEIDNIYSYIYDYCKDWLCDGTPDFRVKVPASEIECYVENCGYPTTPDVVERVLMCKKIACMLPKAGAFLLHGGVVEYEGHGIIFSAKRGVGKTTHINLWRDAFGDKVKVINGDKPFVKKRNGHFVACGTPWRGKEGMGDGSCTKIDKLCFIERSQAPYVKKISNADAWERISMQTIFPKDREYADAYAEMLADFIRSTEVYIVGVNMNVESAFAVRNGILTV